MGKKSGMSDPVSLKPFDSADKDLLKLLLKLQRAAEISSRSIPRSEFLS